MNDVTVDGTAADNGLSGAGDRLTFSRRTGKQLYQIGLKEKLRLGTHSGDRDAIFRTSFNERAGSRANHYLSLHFTDHWTFGHHPDGDDGCSFVTRGRMTIRI
jgi:hypothetical protein